MSTAAVPFCLYRATHWNAGQRLRSRIGRMTCFTSTTGQRADHSFYSLDLAAFETAVSERKPLARVRPSRWAANSAVAPASKSESNSASSAGNHGRVTERLFVIREPATPKGAAALAAAAGQEFGLVVRAA
ncbi:MULTISPECIES: hypothetical protein [unclassified Bradyrhizobium]|uniref:hypothetical protein n=1 Tax=unclassified Bradyrhizobium TaxID=2631580 RepID=UPI00339406BD